jgi:hypothetical protein
MIWLLDMTQPYMNIPISVFIKIYNDKQLAIKAEKFKVV